MDAAVLSILLIWVSCVDFVKLEIPDTASALLFLTGLVFAYSDHLQSSLLAAFCWAALFWVVAKLAKHFLRQDGLGLGDVKLMAGIGAWLGFVLPIYVVLSASVAGTLTILVSEGLKPSALAGKAVAFGPFLCLSTWVLWLREAGL